VCEVLCAAFRSSSAPEMAGLYFGASPVLFLFLLYSSPLQAQMPTLDGFTGSTFLIPDVFILYWKPAPASIQFGLVANTPGYLAFGIAAAGQVNGTGADIIMSSSDPVTSSVSTIDMNIRAKNLPAGYSNCPSSICQDVSLGCSTDTTATFGQRNGSYLIVRFTRQLTPGDTTCDLPIVSGENQVVWAIGAGTVPDGLFLQHTAAGQRAISFDVNPPVEDDSCRQYSDTDCGTCTDVSDCVWCDDTSGCSDGKPNGLTITVPKDCKYWYWGQCTIAGEALGTPFTYSILLSLAILIFVCCCLGLCLIIGKLVQNRRKDRDSFEMKAYH